MTCYINIPDSHHVKLNWPYLLVPSLFLGYMVCGLWGNGGLKLGAANHSDTLSVFSELINMFYEFAHKKQLTSTYSRHMI